MDAIPGQMELRQLGQSSLQASRIAYGCWRFAGSDTRSARDKIETALSCGINLFDHADIYGGDGAAERLFGEVLSEAPELRDHMLIATKCGIIPGIPYNSSEEHIVASAEGSLKRLRCDIIDLYQIHRPDLLAHPEEIAGALELLRRTGKIREVGVSNYLPSQLDALQAFLPFPIVTSQPELSALFLDPFVDGTLDQCIANDITPLAWSPLGGGRLALSRDEAAKLPDGARVVRTIDVLDRIAKAKDSSRSAVTLAFLLHHPAEVIPIIGTQKTDRIRDSVSALELSLSKSDWYDIFEASLGQALP